MTWLASRLVVALTSPMSALPAARTRTASSCCSAVATVKTASPPEDRANRLNEPEEAFCKACSLSSVTVTQRMMGMRLMVPRYSGTAILTDSANVGNMNRQVNDQRRDVEHYTWEQGQPNTTTNT